MSSAFLLNASEARVAYLGVRLVSAARLLGLVPNDDERGVDNDQIVAALAAFSRHGVGRVPFALQEQFTAATLSVLLEEALAAMESSPMPHLEWGPLSELLGEDLLARLVGVSATSLRRYRTGERATPDVVARRLHFVMLITTDLAGSYNDFGIRRWYSRPRSALGGEAPTAVFSGDWGEDDVRVRQVRDLARSLLGAAAS
ncbi:hypothetical protein [Tomitella gaofuii]|uniref:hypothetical protein n=1 Tax=Tomitella gaofuii TaxID=2760083 RepID=UPI0015FC26BB|nr:hypothetical protein [Tomitella gaofuii]